MLPIGLIVLSAYWLGNNPYQWHILLMVVISIGYTHFGIGAYYQLRTFQKQPKRRFLYTVFSALVLLSALVMYCFQTLGLLPLVAFFVVPYFMLHGYFNEQTLFSRSFTIPPPNVIFFGLAVWGTAAAIFAFQHQSAFFAPNLTFLSMPEIVFLLDLWDTTFYRYSFLGSCILSALALGVTGFTILKQPGSSLIVRGQFVVIAVATWYMYQYGPFNYVYMFTLLLGYHFLTWMFYFGSIFYTDQSGRFRPYIMLHVLIIGGAWITYVLYGFVDSTPARFVFNSSFFLFLTLAHVTTSFMNDGWFKKRFL